MRITLHLTVVALIILNTIAVPAQRKASRAKSSPQSSFDQLPFNNLRDELPPHYYGHSIVTLVNPLIAFEKRAVKSEFETTDDYQLRLSDLWSSRLTGSLRFDNLMAFLISNNDEDEEQLTATYDADLGMMNVRLQLRSHYDSDSRRGDYYRATWAQQSKRVGGYVGRNAFNRATRVQVYRNDDFYLAMPGTSLARLTNPRTEDGRLSDTRFNGTIDFSIVMGATEARAVKPRLRALVVGLLDENPYSYEFDRDTPEIDDPYDRYNHSHTVAIIPQEFWIYDLSSGKVYTKLTTEPSSIARRRANNRSVPVDYSGIFSPRDVDQKAVIITRPSPIYPPAARQKQVSGTVVLRAVFAASGEVTNLTVIEGLPEGVTESAIEAAKKITFTPAKINGRAVSQYIQIEYTFSLY